MGPVRVLVNTPGLPDVQFLSGDEGQDADGAVTVTVTRADGSALATAAATVSAGDGRYTFALAAQTRLDRLKLVWTGTFGGLPSSLTTYVEIVGGFYVSLAELRSSPNLGAAHKYDDVDLAEARAWFEDTFEDHTGVAWVPRSAREKVSAGRRGWVVLRRHPVRAVTSVRSYTSAVDYSEFTADELADLDVSDSGIVRRQWLGSWPSGYRNLVVEYEHGYDAPPADICRAAVVGIREGLLTNKVGSRQFSVATDQGIVREAVASERYPFGVPFVDAVANRHRSHRTPAIA